MSEVILHHYPASPVSEKVRIALGLKGLAWYSVEIPRVPPKPDLMPLTGGYRRTPVMQIGADIFCDSHCILRELHRRYPQPTFFPANSEGLTWMFGRWTDALFDPAAKLLIGANAGQLPEAFLQDRGRLFFGPKWDIEAVKRDVPHVVAQLRAQFGWIDRQLAGNGPFLLGNEPALMDAMAYYLVWFVRARWQGGPGLLREFPAIEAWEPRVKAVGHGKAQALTGAQAIEIARAAQTLTPEHGDTNDPQGFQPGTKVGVVADLDSGEPVVIGKLHRLDADSIAILRDDAQVGTVCVHFPRVGYRVSAV